MNDQHSIFQIKTIDQMEQIMKISFKNLVFTKIDGNWDVTNKSDQSKYGSLGLDPSIQNLVEKILKNESTIPIIQAHLAEFKKLGESVDWDEENLKDEVEKDATS